MADERSKVLKVVFVDDNLEPIVEGSQQLPEDPFKASWYKRGLVDPPLSLEQLLHLSDTHPIHSSAIEQKTADIVGTGWEWKPRHDDAQEEQRDQIEEWFTGLFPDADPTPHEAIVELEDDVQTFATGYWEIARDSKGEVRRLYNVPAHTVRFHRDNKRLAQVRRSKLVWFKRWSADTDEYVDTKTGEFSSNVELSRRANELLVVRRRRSRRSSFYGTPTYISAVGWLTLALAARDDNLLFFSNRREPRWAIVLSNLEGEDDDLEEQIRRAFTHDLQQPHRNIIIPITGPGRVDFHKMSSDRAEGSFPGLTENANAMALVAHRLPPERLGMVRIGPLGGNAAPARP